MYVEVREVVDYLAKPLFHHVPRAKISWLSEELANTLIITIINDKAGIPSSELPKDKEGFYVARDETFLCPLIIKCLTRCAITPHEFVAQQQQSVRFKIDVDELHWNINGTKTRVDAQPYKLQAIEYPARVLHAAHADARLRAETYDAVGPPDFVPMQLVDGAELGYTFDEGQSIRLFRAVGVETLLCRAIDIKKLPTNGDERLSTGNNPQNVKKVDFFPAGWWLRGLMKTPR